MTSTVGKCSVRFRGLERTWLNQLLHQRGLESPASQPFRSLERLPRALAGIWPPPAPGSAAPAKGSGAPQAPGPLAPSPASETAQPTRTPGVSPKRDWAGRWQPEREGEGGEEKPARRWVPLPDSDAAPGGAAPRPGSTAPSHGSGAPPGSAAPSCGSRTPMGPLVCAAPSSGTGAPQGPHDEHHPGSAPPAAGSDAPASLHGFAPGHRVIDWDARIGVVTHVLGNCCFVSFDGLLATRDADDLSGVFARRGGPGEV